MSDQLETTITALPAPGIYDGVPRSIYESWPAINQSKLKLFADPRTPAHAKHDLDFPPEPTEALNLGDAFHAAILEPARFEAEFAKAPKCDRRTTAGKIAWTTFQEANVGKQVLPAADWNLNAAMSAAIWCRDTEAKAILEAPGRSERSAIWKLVVDGVELFCKGRIDRTVRWRGETCLIDTKTTKCAAHEPFGRDVWKYFYFAQAAFYLDGLKSLADVPRKWLWIAIEKQPPYLSAVYEPTERMIEQGRRAYMGWLRQWMKCISSGEWPGYPNEIQEIELPRWAEDFGD